MDIEQRMTCARGNNDEQGKAKCRYIEDGVLYTCSAYVCISGRNPNTGEDLKDEWRCVDTWIPILLVEAARTNRGQTAAIEGLRNVVDEGSKAAQRQLEENNARLPRQ